jgi:hypothetical protein
VAFIYARSGVAFIESTPQTPQKELCTRLAGFFCFCINLEKSFTFVYHFQQEYTADCQMY